MAHIVTGTDAETATVSKAAAIRRAIAMAAERPENAGAISRATVALLGDLLDDNASATEKVLVKAVTGTMSRHACHIRVSDDGTEFTIARADGQPFLQLDMD